MFSLDREKVKGFFSSLVLSKLKDLRSLLQEEISAREGIMVREKEIPPTKHEIQRARDGKIASAVDNYGLRTGASFVISSMVIDYWKDDYHTFPNK